MIYSEDIIEEIRVRNDIVDVISSYVKLQKKGSSHMGLCPFHNEKSPSFAVSRNKQIYHCFGCSVSGNVITFIMEYENYNFLEAVKLLAERAGIDLPKAEYSEEAKRQASLKSMLFDIQKEAAKYYFYQLKSPGGNLAYNYLKNRGLTDETIKGFGLGYADSNLYRYIKKLNYKDDILKQSGLFTMDERGVYDKFFNRVVFPIMDVNNKVIGFGGRVMGDGMPKYLNSPETKIFDKSRNLYGMNLARKSRQSNILICEGYLDVIMLHQAGFNNAVASLGTALTGLQANLLKRYTQEVLLMYDSDGAGIKATLRAIPILKEAGLSVKVVNLEPYKDPDEFITNLGNDLLKERLDKAGNSFLFEIEIMKREFDLSDPEQKTRFYNGIAKKLLEFTEELERNNYIEAVSSKYNIGFDNLRKLVNNYGAKLGFTSEYNKPQSLSRKKIIKEDGIKQSQKILLTWLIEDTGLYKRLKGIVDSNDFKDSIYNQVAILLFEQLENNSVVPAKIINNFESKEEQNEVASLFCASIRDDMSIKEQEKLLNDTIRRIKRYSLDMESKNTDANNLARLQEIIREQTSLQKLHISLNDG